MEDSSLCGASFSDSENRGATCSSSASSGDHNTMDKLSTCLSGELKINDGNRANAINDARRIPVEGYYIEEEEEGEGDDFSEEELLAQMGYSKSEPTRDYEEEEEDLAQMRYIKSEPPEHEPVSIPVADLTLVSAFKGSREKEGKPPKECRVSWALDVYDPPFTSDDHFTPGKTEKHKSEHKAKVTAGKNKQKGGGKGAGPREGGGKGSRGGGSKGTMGGKAAGKNKDKKTKKHGGSASKYSDHGGE